MAPVMLLSGGLDSIAAWRLLGCPQAVFVEYGQEGLEREGRAVRWAAGEAAKRGELKGVRGLVLPDLPTLDNGYTPYRNALFVLHAAASFPNADRIVVAQVAEWAPDKNLRFWRRLTRLMNEMTRSRVNDVDRTIEVVAPFAGVTKGQLLERYLDKFGIHALLDLVENTWSCYHDGELHCGACSGCVQRAQAEHAICGGPFTDFEVEPDVRDWYAARARRGGLTDGWRWVRGNGPRSLVARWWEVLSA